MPTPWSMVDASFPTFTGEENVKDQLTKLCDYMYLLVEELKYQLSNLNSKNFNSNALATLKTETTADVTEGLAEAANQLELVINEVASINGRLRMLEALTGRVEDVEEIQEGLADWVAELNLTLEKLAAVLKPDGSGGATLGNDGQELRLVGKVYINGTLIE